MECKNTVSEIDRENDNKNVQLSQKKLDEFSNLYSQKLRAKVKEIQLQHDILFLEKYFKDYEASEVISEDGEKYPN